MATAYLIMDIDGVLIPYPDADGRTPATHTRHLVTPTGCERQPAVAIWLNHAHGQMIRGSSPKPGCRWCGRQAGNTMRTG